MNNKGFKRPISRNQLPRELQSIGRHLVYSEGTKTEPKYIDNIKRLIAKKYQVNHNSIEIIIANEESTNTIYLVEMAKNDVRNRLKNDEKIDHVWIFFDKDDFPIKNYNKANATIHKLNDSSKKNDQGFFYDTKRNIVWHSCYSNEAFELWLCLYFNLIESALSRNELIEKLNNEPKLKKIGFKYSKNMDNIHDILVSNGGSLAKAIKNAKKLAANKQKNPSTGVFEFLEFFKRYINN